jgi:hypothetical protein
MTMTLLGKPVGSEPVTNERKGRAKQQMIWKIWIRPADRQSSNFALLVEEHWHRPGGQECRQGRSIQSTGCHVLCEDSE